MNKSTAYLCFLTCCKLSEINISSMDEDVFQDSDDSFFELLKLSQKYKIKSKYVKTDIKKLAALNKCAIMREKDGSYFVFLGIRDDKALIFKIDEQEPISIALEELSDICEDRALLIVKQKGQKDENSAFGFKWFIPTILKFKKQFVFVLLAVFIIQIFGVLTPLMTQVVVDKVLSHHAMSTLYTITIGILIVYVYELFISLCKNYIFVHTTNRIDVILSHRLFHHLFSLPLKYFETRRVGETIARVRELDTIRSFLTGTPLSSLIDLMFIVVYIVVLFFYSIPLSIIVLVSIPVFALLSLIVTPLFKKSLEDKFETGAKAQSFLVESVNGIQTVKSFALEEKFERKWGDLQSDYVKAGYRTSMISQTSGSIANFIQQIFDLIILAVGAKAVIDGQMTIGQLVAFRMLAGRVSGPVLRLVRLWQEYQQASLSVKRIGDIFNSKSEDFSDSNNKLSPDIKGNIRFERVRFRYRIDASDVIKDMSFEIKSGSIVGIVGRSGSGKSTLSKLLQLLYRPQSGKISIDGNDLALMDPVKLRKKVGVVLQENFVFNGTVAENIAIHCKNASMKQIMEAAKTAGAHDFIMELNEGYNTIIGEKGVALSGGQKQRLAIARAIIHNPAILIFDEATSALDYESESIIQNNMKTICEGRTVLIIAHRLSTLRIADEIMVIDRGEIIERGTHKELIDNNGLYAMLYNKQLNGEVE